MSESETQQPPTGVDDPNQPYTISIIPVGPVSEDHITQYSLIRLAGLKQDAHAFISTYERESQFSRDVWRSRLETRGRFTLIAHTGTSLDDPTAEWCGTATVLTPAMLLAHNYEPPYEHLASKKEETAAYDVVGMWVQHKHRRKGLVEMLVKKLIDIARNDKNEERNTRAMVLQVNEGNIAAAKAYTKCGFVDRGVWNGDDEKEVWMIYEIPR